MCYVAANHVARASAANVDPIAVTQDLHRMVDLVELNEVVTRVQVGADIGQRWVSRESSNLMPSDRANRFTLVLPHEEAGNGTGDDQRRVVRMVDQIVRHTVLPALADVDPW